MKTKQFYPLLVLLFSLLLTLAFTGQAKAEETEVSCGLGIEETVTMTVTDDFEYGLTLFAATSPADVLICNEIADPHWSIPMCGDGIWRGWLEVPTECNTITISDTQVTQVLWVDESVIWDVNGQELVRATVTETLPLPTPTYEVWSEDSGRDIHIWTSGYTTTVYLDSVPYANWTWIEERQKSQLIISQKPFGASFNTGSVNVSWENYAAYWRVSPENTVNRIRVSPTRIQVFSENGGADVFLFNLDLAAFDVYLDEEVIPWSMWTEFGEGKLWLKILGRNDAKIFSLGSTLVIWEDYSLDWDVSTINTVVRVNPPTVMYMIYLPATMK